MFIDISTLSTDICHNVLLSLCIYSIVSKPWNKWRSHGPSLTVSSLFQAMRGAEQQLRAAEVQPGPGDLEFMAISWRFYGDFMGSTF
jgi:hypothetical protein